MKRRGRKKPTKIIAAVRISRASGRDLLSGIFRFLEENPDWQMHLVQYEADFTPDIVRSAPGKGFGGIIASFLGADGTAEALSSSPLPVVWVCVDGPAIVERKNPAAIIRNDNAAIGRLAAATFLKNGNYAAFAYVPKTDERWCEERGDAFASTLAQSGRECARFRSGAFPHAPCEDHDGLAAFLASLPKPAAVYAASDECAVKTLAAADEAGIKIPEQMALMGTDNDEFLVRHADPPVSSILPGHVKMGMRAATEMKKLLAGRKSPAAPVVIPPVSVIERTSTRPVLPAAALVRRAKAYIAANACKRIEVADIAGHLGVSRRLAELRFRQFENKSLRQALEERRLAEARRLLENSSISVSGIAARCGFSGQNRLSHVFKARFGLAPEHWRRRGQDRPARS